MRTAARIRSVGVHVLPATALLLAGCGGDDVHLGVGANPPNVLVLTLDTTRADRLGCYGHADAQTPHLAALAARGTRFERAYSPVPLTLPAHATLWTGLQPPEHSIHDNGRNALARDVPHVAEALQRAGWSTGAFVSSAVLDAAFGLARGFDVYDDRMSAVDAQGDAEPPQRVGDATTDAAIDWLSTAREPFLAWVHYYDPHSTYEPPEPWKHRLKSPYDGEIAFMDAQIGRVLAALEGRESLENTIVVVVADHGESLGEHGESTHGLFAYDATLRIPLIIAGAGRTARVEETAVEMADIAPTIFELCGRGPWEGGRSLVPALQGAALAPRPIFGESEYGWLAFGWSPLHTVVSDGWRYIGSSDPELYEHARDPAEVVDLATGSAGPASVAQRARLERELTSMRAAFTPRGTSAAAVDEDLRARMSNLGYAQSTSTPDGLPGDMPSPRAMLSVYEDFSRGVGFAQHGQPERALPLLRRATEAWPRGALMHQQLGIALQLAARHADAIASLTRALELDPSLEQSAYFRGLARTGTGEYDEAIADFDRALKLRPEAYLPLVAKAWALVRVGREDEAAVAMRRVVATKPRDVAYAVSLARLLRNLGHDAESVAVLTRAQAENPEEIGLALYLAWELATNPDDAARDGTRALKLAEQALKARSHGAQGDANPDELDTLAAAYAELGRFDEAVTVMDRVLRAAGTGADPELIAEWTARRAGYAEKRPFRDG